MYNRASADPQGSPGQSEALRLVGRGGGKWTGYDEVEFSIDKPPDYEPDWSSTRPAWTRTTAARRL